MHEGKHIPWDELFELREIVRKTIVLMYEREMYSPNLILNFLPRKLLMRGI